MRDCASPSWESQSTTWIYYEEINSWKTIDNVANGPPAMSYVQLVTLCSSHAVVVHLDAIKSTWIFMYKQLEWKQVTIAGYGPHVTNKHDLFVAVAVRSSNSSCGCSEDVLVFVYLNHDWETITRVGYYRLSCVIEHTTYRWKKIGIHTFRSNRFHITYVVTPPGETTLVFVIARCIWTYSVEKSIWNESKICVLVDPVTDLVLRPVFLTDTREILFFNLRNRSIIRLFLSNTSAFYEKNPGLIPNVGQVYSVRVVSGSKVMVYLSENGESCGSSTWILERDDVGRLWFWNKLKKTVLVPSPYTLQSFWNDICYRIVDLSVVSSTNEDLVPSVIWSLSMHTKKWQIQGHLNVTGINVDDAKMWYRSKSTHMQENVWLIVSDSYSTTLITNENLQQMRSRVPPRSEFTLVTINSSSALLFGGINSSGVVLNDLWEFSVTHRMWKKVNTTEHEWSVPPSRSSHAAAVAGFDMFVIGGYNYSKSCIQELWKYNLINNSWSILISNNKFLRPAATTRSCKFAMIAQAEMLWIAAKVFSDAHNDGSDNVWMFILHSQTLTLAAERPTRVKTKSVPDYILATSSLIFWQGYLVGFDLYGIMYMKVGCPRGLTSSDISRFPCHFCKVGFYADVVGSTECRRCPNGTTTKGERSSTVTDCNVCSVAGYCRHGSCLVVSNSLTQVPVCTCHAGFTGSRCQDATYYYIGTGAILLVGIIGLLVTVLGRIIRNRRARETAFHRHIQILDDAWQISWQEITLQNEIGGGASGRVRKAQYRDMDVAVKMLIGDDDPQSSLEFAREIKFMQTMRHPNIVLFIGAGKTSPQAQPFLVIEFVHRGSLRHVLDDVNIEIDQNRKIAFALGASKGMEFLHVLDPPRIHRDLKSDNLLVGQSWIVKVADFGLGKPIREHRQSKKSKPLIDNHSQIDPLYEMTEIFSEDGIGTVRWRAPELSRRQGYDGSIDVYRYVLEDIRIYNFIH